MTVHERRTTLAEPASLSPITMMIAVSSRSSPCARARNADSIQRSLDDNHALRRASHLVLDKSASHITTRR